MRLLRAAGPGADWTAAEGKSQTDRMALVFRWYLGMGSPAGPSTGEPDRTRDYQIWCGPAMGAFNDWVAGSYLAPPENRRVAEVAHHLLRGAAFVTRLGYLRHAGVALPAAAAVYRPKPLAATGW